MKIQLKRSNVLEGGAAKKPTPAQMEYGELAVNYNASDPSIFLKDSTDSIVKVGGDLDQYYTKEEINNLNWDTTEADGRYLRIDAGAPDQTRVAGKATFSETTTHKDGIYLTGSINEISSISRESSGTDLTLSIKGNKDDDNVVSVYSESAYDGNYIFDVFRNANGNGNLDGIIRAINKTTGITDAVNIESIQTELDGIAANGEFTHYSAVNLYYSSATNISVYGYRSNLLQGVAPNGEVYANYHEGTAPNYFRGDTYIGGDTSRNTFELWKSTLTEEQLDQLEAGTFAVPANVSIPGDGSFARQWWYDQQSAEDQALIDSGELEYPERLKAANFTDTFALGDNTKINLLNSGRGEFTGAVGFKAANGTEYAAIDTCMGYTGNALRLKVEGSEVYQVNSTTKTTTFKSPDSKTWLRHLPDNADSEVRVDLSLSTKNNTNNISIGMLAAADISGDTDSTKIVQLFRTNSTIDAATDIASLETFVATGPINDVGSNGDYVGFSARSSCAVFADDNAYGFKSDLGSSTNTRGANVYNFYAAGDAPNYFAGVVRVAIATDSVDRFLVRPGGTFTNNITGDNSTSPPQLIRRCHASAANIWTAIRLQKADADGSNAVTTSNLTLGGANFRTIDTRLGATGTAMPDGAANIVKLLQPKVITQGGETFNGFLPADLAGTFSAAVDGTAGATTAIGTYTNPEGVEETEVEEPEAIPFGATWVQTGTRDEMQGVCREELIPLLTKALQEALDKIETLETRLSDAGIA